MCYLMPEMIVINDIKSSGPSHSDDHIGYDPYLPLQPALMTSI